MLTAGPCVHGAPWVLDTGAVTRGSGSKHEDRERAIRKWFVDRDLIDGVILLPDNLFYNTSAAGVIVVLAKRKPAARKDRIVLVNAGRRVRKGRPKNFIPAEDIDAWPWRPLGELFEIGAGKTMTAAARNGTDKIPFLRTSNVLWDEIDLSSVDEMSIPQHECPTSCCVPATCWCAKAARSAARRSGTAKWKRCRSRVTCIACA